MYAKLGNKAHGENERLIYSAFQFALKREKDVSMLDLCWRGKFEASLN